MSDDDMTVISDEGLSPSYSVYPSARQTIADQSEERNEYNSNQNN